jgi:excisionase family DNA binding protein
MIVIANEEYLSADEACALLGVKPATLYAYVSRGRLRSYRRGIKRQRYYRRAEVEALLRLRPSDEARRAARTDELPAAEQWIPYT